MMRHLFSLAALVAVVLISLGAPRSWVEVGAQEATPDPMMARDIAVALADLGIVDALPSTPVAIGFYRLEFPPGATLSFEPGDSGIGLWAIESGTLTLRNFSGDIQVTRASDQAAPGAQASAVLSAGSDAHLGPGEGFVWLPPLGGEVRNDSTEPVVLWTVDIRTQTEEMAATPAL